MSDHAELIRRLREVTPAACAERPFHVARVVGLVADEFEAAQVAGPAREPQWQPMATAPHDRTWFLAWSEDLGFLVYRMGPGLITEELPDPTHWMPLPTAPSPSPTPKPQG